MTEYEIVRSGDPRCAELERLGYRVVGESWGARLYDPDPELLQAAVDAAEEMGLLIRELDVSYAEALHHLETTNQPDYPYTPATEHHVGSLDDVREHWNQSRIFGALDGTELVGATVMRPTPERADTQFTSVLAAYRGRGVGKAVKAASILAMLDLGITAFGTGGAGVNAGSIGANESLGYTLTERWYSYAPPA